MKKPQNAVWRDMENRMFQEKWINLYFVRPWGAAKVICFICKQVNLMHKEFKHHYETTNKS